MNSKKISKKLKIIFKLEVNSTTEVLQKYSI